MRSNVVAKWAFGAPGVVVGGILALSIMSWAQSGDSEPRKTIPYEGYVDFNGAPVNASVKFNFALFPCDQPGGAGGCAPIWLAQGDWIYEDLGEDVYRPFGLLDGWPEGTGIAVPVSSGRFSTELGGTGHEALPAEIFRDHEYLYLAIQVEKKAMSALQRISPAPRAQVTSHSVPPGTVSWFAGHNDRIPKGWIPCDGRPLLIADYPALYNAIGTVHGGDETNFKVPDMMGRFVQASDTPSSTQEGSNYVDPLTTDNGAHDHDSPMGFHVDHLAATWQWGLSPYQFDGRLLVTDGGDTAQHTSVTYGAQHMRTSPVGHHKHQVGHDNRPASMRLLPIIKY